jgi:hypothetical protein
MTSSIVITPLKYANNEANAPKANVFNDTDAFQHIIFIYIFIYIKKIDFFII